MFTGVQECTGQWHSDLLYSEVRAKVEGMYIVFNVHLSGHVSLFVKVCIQVDIAKEIEGFAVTHLLVYFCYLLKYLVL